MGNSLYTLILRAAEENPEGTFFIYRNERITYRDAIERVQKIAYYLAGRGVGPGDRILLNIGNIPEFIYVLLAAAQRGVISVLSNPAYRGFELQHLIEEVEPKLAVTTGAGMANFLIDGTPVIDPEKIIFSDEAERGLSLGAIQARGKRDQAVEAVDDRHPAVVIYTAAMSGAPLGALVTHRAILETSAAASRFLFSRGDAFLAALPLFHSFGLTTTLFIPLFNMTPFYLIDRFSPKTVCDLLLGGNISIFPGVPKMFELLARVIPDGAAFKRVRAWISGGEAISIGLQRDFKDRYGVEIRQGYGLTEASPIVTWNMLEKPNVFGSIGTPMPYNQVKLVDRDTHEATEKGPGEIMVKGMNVISGYYRQDEAANRIFEDGWIHTGDVAVKDENGYYFIKGRLKEMIIRNGFNVYPAEVTRILSKHPSVDRVTVEQVSVRNEEDNTFSERIEATVYRRKGQQLDESSFRAWCREHICAYKIPDSFRLVD